MWKTTYRHHGSTLWGHRTDKTTTSYEQHQKIASHTTSEGCISYRRCIFGPGQTADCRTFAKLSSRLHQLISTIILAVTWPGIHMGSMGVKGHQLAEKQIGIGSIRQSAALKSLIEILVRHAHAWCMHTAAGLTGMQTSTAGSASGLRPNLSVSSRTRVAPAAGASLISASAFAMFFQL